MRRLAIAAALIAFIPAVHAQSPDPARAAQAEVAAQLARALSSVTADNATLQAQVAGEAARTAKAVADARAAQKAEDDAKKPGGTP